MSSGRNWIGIRSVGRTRLRLADALCKLTGVLVEAHKIGRTNPYQQHYDDCCAWDTWGTDSHGRPVHIYSFDRMSDCVRGMTANTSDPQDIEVTAVNDPS